MISLSTLRTAGVSALLLLLLAYPSHASAILYSFESPDSNYYRVLPGTETGEYWIVSRGEGLQLITVDENGIWQLEGMYGYGQYDAIGPDYRNRIYCTGLPGLNSGISVFNCSQQQRDVEDTLILGADYPLNCLALSPDQSSLYVVGYDWPRIGECGSPLDVGAHLDSGIIWQIDLNTMTINDQNITAALPENVFYVDNPSGPDKLYVSTEQGMIYNNKILCVTDVLLASGMSRQSQIYSPVIFEQYRNDFLQWSDDPPRIAMLCNEDVDLEEEQYHAGIVLIDPQTDEVVDWLIITDETGLEFGVQHACISDVHPGVVYISTNVASPFDLMAIDYDTGEVLDKLDTPQGFHSQFIYETPDGLLIVTGGTSGKILIIDPEG